MLEPGQSPNRLVEFLTAVSEHEDAAAARITAAQLAAEEFDAEMGALVAGGTVEASVGFGAGDVPTNVLLGIEPGDREIELPGLGLCHVATASWEAAQRGLLIVARMDAEFTAEERNLLLGMARGVGLTLRMTDALEAEYERRRLLEVLLDIQRAISHRRPLPEVLAAVTDGATSLLAGRLVSLILDDVVDEAAGAVAPVHINGAQAGALVADQTGSDISPADRSMLAAFADHASMALTDARMVEAIDEAYHDAVTGLPNRALFLDRLDRALARGGARLAVLFIDLDRFKAVNDSLGHAAGDELLRAVGERIAGCVRGADTAARFGGDEFALLLTDTDPTAVDTITERIIATVQRAFPLRSGNVFVGATVGIAYGRETDDPETLLRNADLAMYQAKNAGGGRAAAYRPSMHTAAVKRIELEADLQAAMSNDQLRLDYQPVLELATGRTVALEALLRWQHPERGLVAPGEFIPIAEETGSIVAIGRWVIQHACDQLATWREHHPHLTLNLNVSAVQLRDPAFPDDVEAALAAAGIPGEALTLEITETQLIGDSGEIPRDLDRLKRLGVAIAIDDFGTGYSSLRYLQRLPVDVLKIDRSFVDALPGSAQDRGLVRMIIELGRTMGISNVAEGIETAEQQAELTALGCSHGQGFHLARPMQEDQVPAYLALAARTLLQ